MKPKPNASGRELQKYLNTPLQCVVCHRMLNRRRDGYYQCPECNATYKDNLMKAKEYLFEHPDASFEEICEGARLPEETLLFFLDNDMITIPNTNKNFSVCKNCGRMIIKGRYCNNCALSTLNRIQEDFGEEKEGMHGKWHSS